MRDPYRVLGVPRSADAETIRRAYKTQARRWHPDLNPAPGAAERFKEVNAAYAILGDQGKRRMWDHFGAASTRPGFRGATGRSPNRGFAGRPGGVDDLWDAIFNQTGATPRAGRDQRVELVVELLDAVRGREVTLSVERGPAGPRQVRVVIPAGAEDGAELRLRGEGGAAFRGGPRGDLVVQIKVRAHAWLRRHGNDLEMDVPITVLEAVRGGAITVPTPHGDIRLTVPPGVTSGQRLRVRGRGVQREGQSGDLYVVLRPTVPREASPEALAAAELLEEAYTENPRAALKL